MARFTRKIRRNGKKYAAVTIPEPVLAGIGLKIGDKVVIEDMGDKIIIHKGD